VIFRFIDEPGKDDLRVDAKPLDQLTLELTLVNFKNPIGSGTTTAIRIGTLAGHPLYLHYRVHDLGGIDKTLHFTIYQLDRAE
jgi:hypothetical protein